MFDYCILTLFVWLGMIIGRDLVLFCFLFSVTLRKHHYFPMKAELTVLHSRSATIVYGESVQKMSKGLFHMCPRMDFL